MNLFVAISVLGVSAMTSASGFGVPGWFLRFLGGATVGGAAADEEECCCKLEVVWFGLISSLDAPKKGEEDEAAAIFFNFSATSSIFLELFFSFFSPSQENQKPRIERKIRSKLQIKN